MSGCYYGYDEMTKIETINDSDFEQKIVKTKLFGRATVDFSS